MKRMLPLKFRAVYNAVLFEPSRIEELLRQLEIVLLQCSKSPQEKIVSPLLVTEAAVKTLPSPVRDIRIFVLSSDRAC